MQEIIDDMSKLELFKNNNSIGYGILPPNLKNSLSIEKIEEIEENLDELMKYVQPASDPRSKTKPPKISSTDPINVCYLNTFIFNFILTVLHFKEI
jgi:hypothetical protein